MKPFKTKKETKKIKEILIKLVGGMIKPKTVFDKEECQMLFRHINNLEETIENIWKNFRYKSTVQ